MSTWKPIPGHEGYEVHESGRVRSVDRIVIKKNKWGSHGPVKYAGKELKPWATKDGYLQVELKDGKKQCVHRLVAMAFVDGHENGLTVNHKDGVKSNNHPSNLEWITAQENTLHAVHELDVYKKKPVAVALIAADGLTTAKFRSVSDAARFLGVYSQAVSSALHRGGTCRKFKVVPTII